MEPILRLFKHADKLKNRIILPKKVIKKYGYDYYLEVYKDGTMKLIPVKKGE